MTTDTIKARYLTPESQFVTVRLNHDVADSKTLDVHVRVTGHGPDLLLLHGLTSSLHTWDVWHDVLSEHFRVISMDVPGFGLTSAIADGDYSVSRYVSVFTQIMDQLSVTACHVAGNSFGGFLAWQLACAEPERVTKLVLLDATGYPRDSLPMNYHLAMSPVFQHITHRVTPRGLVRKAVRRVYGDASRVDDALVTRYRDLLMYQRNRQALSEILRTHFDPVEDGTMTIRGITQPTLILWGSDDAIVPVQHAKQFARDIAGAILVIYPGVGHVPMEEVPTKSAADVLAFLA